MEIYKNEDLPVAVNPKAISKCLEELPEKDREYIEKRAEEIISLNNTANKNYLEIGKRLWEIKARFISDKGEKAENENESEEEAENFIEYARTRFSFAKSTAYGLAKTWESWKDYNLAEIPTLFSPSTLLILSGDGLDELRKRIVDLAQKYHISANMARNALRLWKAGAAAKAITISKIATTQTQKEIDTEKDGEKGDEKPEIYKSGNKVEIRIVRHGADDSEVIEALQNALEELTGTPEPEQKEK